MNRVLVCIPIPKLCFRSNVLVKDLRGVGKRAIIRSFAETCSWKGRGMPERSMEARGM